MDSHRRTGIFCRFDSYSDELITSANHSMAIQKLSDRSQDVQPLVKPTLNTKWSSSYLKTFRLDSPIFTAAPFPNKDKQMKFVKIPLTLDDLHELNRTQKDVLRDVESHAGYKIYLISYYGINGEFKQKAYIGNAVGNVYRNISLKTFNAILDGALIGLERTIESYDIAPVMVEE